ncbi:TerC family protein [Actinoallomurus rhizosphaericola]|uniref:TerC family protein n=1 Tax=Actinoallomurus rhizosphaericola TaxID=2952536 RepID=UPI0020921523|nr:TerC family protein [Actinoallomurus rhizosphaericola]MCO5999399.1 TerC family protein [Actinoallomurus rhizosphaericola]
MNVTFWAWGLTLLGLLAFILFDLWVVDRGKPRDFSLRQATAWVTFYVLLAIAFGVGLLFAEGADYSTQFFAGYLTEYSLSVDNLFIFYVIMARFAVPRANQHKVLLIGIMIALVMRGIFIAVGAAALARFEWLFYIFGAFLIWTAYGLVRGEPDEDEYEENILVRWICRVVPTTDNYHEHRMTVRVDGKRLMTPMLIVMIAIGSTDLLFALDSIPAIFGLTKQSYLVFTANAFALMGLRQLYFLLRGLLDRLVYLSKGLAVILAFIGVKLVMEALHTTWFENVPEISTLTSLAVIGATMLVTTAASLIKTPRRSAPGGSEGMDGGQEPEPEEGGGPGDTGEAGGPTVPGPAAPDAAGHGPDAEPQPPGPVSGTHDDQVDADARAGRARR